LKKKKKQQKQKSEKNNKNIASRSLFFLSVSKKHSRQRKLTKKQILLSPSLSTFFSHIKYHLHHRHLPQLEEISIDHYHR